MAETRKLAAILAADVVGFSRLAGADEDRTLARLRALRSDLIDPTIAVHNGRVVKRTGDGAIVEFRSVVDAVRCAIEIQNGMVERNSGLPPERRMDFRIGIHVGDVVEESDGDLMGDGVNIAARLEGIAKPGAICLSSAAYEQVSGRLDMAVTDLGPTELKNIAKPIRAYSLQIGVPAEVKDASRSGSKRPAMPVLAGAALAAVIAAAGGAWYLLGANRPAAVATKAPAAPVAAPAPVEAKRLSIVVLPFTNLSSDPSQDYFADGITENLTTDLSRIRGSFVIARNTAFTYKGKSIDARDIGKQLAVRYVLEGSVQREQNRVRVNAQLIDARSGAHLWAERFEEDVADLFKLQDQVVARLANTLGFELIKAEAARSAGAANPDATDYVMRGKVLMPKAFSNPSKENYDAAITMFDKALAIDPDEVDALAPQAVLYVSEMSNRARPFDKDLAAKALGQAERAIALAPDSAAGYFAKAQHLILFQGKYTEAIRVADEGLAINPNAVGLYVSRCQAELSARQYEPAKSDIQQAMRLNPLDPVVGLFHMLLGFAEFGLGHFDASAEEFSKAIDAGWHEIAPYVGLAAARAAGDHTFEGNAALDQARQINPNITIKYFYNRVYHVPGLFEALGKLGVPYE